MRLLIEARTVSANLPVLADVDHDGDPRRLENAEATPFRAAKPAKPDTDE